MSELLWFVAGMVWGAIGMMIWTDKAMNDGESAFLRDLDGGRKNCGEE